METIQERRGVSGSGLKRIALVLMALDHIHYFFSFTGWVPEWFSMLGRLSAPLFLFCAVEGFTHTRNRKKYFLKVYLLSLPMTVLLLLMNVFRLFVRPDGFYPMNGMMTTFAILIMVWQGFDWLKEKHWLKGLTAVLLPLAWPVLLSLLMRRIPALQLPLLWGLVLFPTWNLSGDASFPVIVTGLLLYLFRKNRRVQAAVFAGFQLLYFLVYVGYLVSQMPGFHWTQMFTAYYEWYGAFAGIFMLCYNGQRGNGHKAFFYIFYPAHIYIFYLLSWAVLLHT